MKAALSISARCRIWPKPTTRTFGNFSSWTGWCDSGSRACRPRLRGGNREIEGGSFTFMRIDPDLAAVAFHDPLANGKPDACAGNALPMQPLEHAEDLLVISGGDPHAIVFHRDPPQAVLAFRGDMNGGGSARLAVFHAVGDGVLQELNEMRLLPLDGRQAIAGDDGLGFLDCRLAILKHGLKNAIQINRVGGRLSIVRHLRIGEQVAQQFAHTLRARSNEFHTGGGFSRELAAIAL